MMLDHRPPVPTRGLSMSSALRRAWQRGAVEPEDALQDIVTKSGEHGIHQFNTVEALD
jgi:hypothetical protein